MRSRDGVWSGAHPRVEQSFTLCRQPVNLKQYTENSHILYDMHVSSAPFTALPSGAVHNIKSCIALTRVERKRSVRVQIAVFLSAQKRTLVGPDGRELEVESTSNPRGSADWLAFNDFCQVSLGLGSCSGTTWPSLAATPPFLPTRAIGLFYNTSSQMRASHPLIIRVEAVAVQISPHAIIFTPYWLYSSTPAIPTLWTLYTRSISAFSERVALP
jgi:hypothetical protein